MNSRHIFGPEYLADILVRIRAHDSKPHTARGQVFQKRRCSWEQLRGPNVAGHQLAHLSGDPRHLPKRHPEHFQNLLAVALAQLLMIALVQLPEPMLLAYNMKNALEPRQRVRQSPIKIKENEPIFWHSKFVVPTAAVCTFRPAEG